MLAALDNFLTALDRSSISMVTAVDRVIASGTMRQWQAWNVLAALHRASWTTVNNVLIPLDDTYTSGR